MNRNLVEDLKALGLWEEVRGDLLRHQGDVSRIDVVPDEIKAVYRTSFQLSPYAFLNVAARAQKWIDQAISRNMYLADRELSTMVDVYTQAWRMGVKTTYYLHMMPRHTAEQSTVKVNKASDRPAATSGAPARRGFGGARTVTPTVAPVAIAPEVQLEIVDGTACPVDPQERLQCDSCQ